MGRLGRARAGALLGLCWAVASAATPHFVNVAPEVGVDFVHRNGASPQKRLPETNGPGVAFFDYDNDGDQDLYLVNGGDMVRGRQGAANGLYVNDNGRFTDRAAAAKAQGQSYGMGVLAGDYDGDGDQDLYLSAWGPDQLLAQGADGVFEDVTAASGLGNPDWGMSALYLDYDRDGDLDLFVANYVHFRLGEQPWCGRADLDLRFYCDPRQFDPSLDRLYRNDGEGGFSEVGPEIGIDQTGNGLGAISADFDEDGWPDLYVANDLTANLLYMNRQGRFAEEGLLAGVAFSNDGAVQAGMGVDAGDYDGDGDEDLFVTNYQLENNNLYRNDGDFFYDYSGEAGIAKRSLDYLGWGALFFDADNDGLLDLFVANGHVHDNIGQYDALVTYPQKAQLFSYSGAGRFTERTEEAGPAFAASYVGRGAAWADYDEDGDVDLALTCLGGAAALLRNDTPQTGHWLQLRLGGQGGNANGIGARVLATIGGRRSLHTIRAGSGFLSTSQKAVHLGLGAATQVDRLEIRWPSGRVQILKNVAAGQRLLIEEPYEP